MLTKTMTTAPYRATGNIATHPNPPKHWMEPFDPAAFRERQERRKEAAQKARMDAEAWAECVREP